MNTQGQTLQSSGYTLLQGVVKVSTGVSKMVKLSAGDALNHNLKLNADENLALAA